MSNLPNVHFGSPQNPPPDWRKTDKHDAPDNDKLLMRTPKSIKALLGFDPLEFAKRKAHIEKAGEVIELPPRIHGPSASQTDQLRKIVGRYLASHGFEAQRNPMPGMAGWYKDDKYSVLFRLEPTFDTPIHHVTLYSTGKGEQKFSTSDPNQALFKILSWLRTIKE